MKVKLMHQLIEVSDIIF